MIRYFLKYRFLIWLLLLLFQAAFTDILNDEAYYWLWSTHLDWGYFDHPPMIAVFIKLGTLLGSSVFFVRLGVVIANLVTIFLIEKIIVPKDVLLLWKIILSIAVLQIGGFIAVPDLPLLFFTVLYFYLLKKQLEREHIKTTLLIGIVAACMLYAKYHAILILGFSVLAIPDFWRKKWVYTFAFLGAILYLPHLWWQYQHEFVSLQYHFTDRSIGEAFNPLFFLDYVGSQILFVGPFLGWLFLYFLFSSKTNTPFEKALKVSGVGIFTFFAIMSLKGKVEANWTNVAFLPLIYFNYQRLETTTKWKKLLDLNLWILLPLLFVIRVYMVYDFLPKKWNVQTEIHGWKEWANDIEKKADQLPVVMMNSYQKAAKYTFYTKQEACSQANAMGRKSQFDIWKSDTKLYGKKAFYLLNWYAPFVDSLHTNKGALSYKIMNPFVSYTAIHFLLNQADFSIQQNDTLQLEAKLSHSFDTLPNMILDSNFIPKVVLHITQGRKRIAELPTDMFITNTSFYTSIHRIKIPLENLEKGDYQFRISVVAGWLPATIGSNRYKLTVH